MTDSKSNRSRKVKNLQSKLQYWQQCYYKLNYKYTCIKEKYDVLSACHNCINEDKKEVQSPLAKKQKMNSEELDVDKNLLDVEMIDDNRQDPLKYLPEPVAVEILEYLKGKELLTAMRVSKTWRDFIKVQSRLMKKIVFKPTRDMCELPLLDEIYNEDNFRHYKHFEGPMSLRKQYFIEARPIELLSSTLETLIIKPFQYYLENSDVIEIACDFPKLRMLTFPVNSSDVSFNLLKSSTFPVLTHLKLRVVQDEEDPFNMTELKQFISLLPKLEVVMFDDNENGTFSFDYDDPRTNETFKFNKEQLKVKALIVERHVEEIFDVFDIFEACIEKLEITYLCEDELDEVLQNCKNLKSLSITSKLTIFEEWKFKRHDLVEVLMINRIEAHLDADTPSDATRNCLKNILTALPSLKVLRLEIDIITPNILKFLARNMINLEILICEDICEEMQRAYDDIQENSHLYVNTKFEFTDAIEWKQIKEEFE